MIICLNLPIQVNAQPDTFPPGSKPFDLSYTDWGIKWWQWLISANSDESPAVDTSGASCALNQNISGPVWFLAGSYGAELITRSCTIPQDKSILISPIETLYTYADTPEAKTDGDLHQASKKDQDLVKTWITIDGVTVPNIADYRVHSEVANFTYPDNNAQGVLPGPTTGVVDGYFVMLKPLPVGKHQVIQYGSLLDSTTGAVSNFGSYVKWDLTIK